MALLSDDGSVTRLSDELSGWEMDQPYVAASFQLMEEWLHLPRGNATTPSELAVVDGLGA